MLLVQKYGGSSVADVAKIRQVASRVARSVAAGHQVVVVVSAMGNTTNELLALAREVARTPGRRELDMLISVGERVSMALLAMALQEAGVAARSFTGSQSGIITDEAHASAQVVEVRADRLKASLAAGEVPIVAGFQGVSRAHEVTTLGRGGSDTTAVVLAAALGADECELCSDVDGVWSADPREVPGAIRIGELSLDEALAMARNGARILAEDAVAWARREGITLRASATVNADGGTLIRPIAPAPRVVAVVADLQLTLVWGDAWISLPTPCIRAAGPWGAVVDCRNLHGAQPGEPIATVAVVGARCGADPTRIVEVLGQASACLGEPPRQWWTSTDALVLVVKSSAAARLERHLHCSILGYSGSSAPP